MLLLPPQDWKTPPAIKELVLDCQAKAWTEPLHPDPKVEMVVAPSYWKILFTVIPAAEEKFPIFSRLIFKKKNVIYSYSFLFSFYSFLPA